MLRSNVLCSLVFLASVLVVFGGQATAGVLIDIGPGAVSSTFAGGNYAAGSEFTTTSSLTIRSLGYLDAEGNGLLGSHSVGLWDTAQNLLASIMVTPSSAFVLSAQGTAKWFMEDITAITIGPGTYRIAGLVGTTDTTVLEGNKIGNGISITSGYVRTEFPGGGFAYPNLAFASQAVRVTLSGDSFATSAVPEPASLAMMGLGGIGMFGGWCRKRRKTAVAV